MRIWALGDIHSNADALRAALRIVDERPGDRLVILGDLLTYGADPQEVLDLVAERAEQGAILVLGNHDEVYRGVAKGAGGPLERMSSWVAASVKWTVGQIDPTVLRDLPFQAEHIEERVLFAHANPWFDRPRVGTRWAYLTSTSDHQAAADVLRARKLRVGVFGHTHHARIVELPSGVGLDRPRDGATWAPRDPRDVLLLNAGAVGQPRNLEAQSTLLEMEGDRDGWTVTVHPVHYDVEAHLEKLRRLPLAEDVRSRLVRFFRPREGACSPSTKPTSPPSVLDVGT